MCEVRGGWVAAGQEGQRVAVVVGRDSRSRLVFLGKGGRKVQ